MDVTSLVIADCTMMNCLIRQNGDIVTKQLYIDDRAIPIYTG